MILEHEIVEVVADKGYQDPKRHGKRFGCRNHPNVIQRDGDDVAEVEFEYVEATVTDDMLNSKKPENLETCLKAGKIPTAYAGILDSPQIGVRKSYECTASSNIKEMSDEELKQLALQGYFVRDAAKGI